MGADATTLRELMASFPTGVAVVTALGTGDEPVGLTCSSLTSVTLEPPTLFLGIRSSSRTLAAIQQRGGCAVGFLHDGGQSVAARFSSHLDDKFAGIAWTSPVGARGPHLVDDAHAVADGVVDAWSEHGDHTAIFLRLERITSYAPHPPLLYGRRRYARWADAADHLPPGS